MQKYMRVYLTKTKTKALFLYLVAYALLWFGYATFIVPIYGCSGFEWAPNMVKGEGVFNLRIWWASTACSS